MWILHNTYKYKGGNSLFCWSLANKLGALTTHCNLIGHKTDHRATKTFKLQPPCGL